MEFNERQRRIIDIVKHQEPITSESIASLLNVTRSTLRTDLSILTKMHILEARPKVGYCFVGDSYSIELLDNVKDVCVSDIMSRSVAVDEKVSIYDAIVTMFLEDVGTIFVLSDNHLAGLISRKDFIKSAIGGADMKSIPVGIIMTRMPNLIVSDVNESIVDAAKKLMDHEIDCMPVVECVEDKYKVIGRISKTNVTEYFVDMFTKL
jgi:predicted transcriptional regulator